MTSSDGFATSVTASEGSDADVNLWNRVRAAGTWWDLPLLVVIPTVLLLAFLLPPDVKHRFALDYTNPTLVTAFVSHFIHFSWIHLLSNLVGGAVVVPTTYLLSVLSGRRRQFLTIFTCFVLAFPFVLSAMNLLFVRSSVGVGFSGIVLAFVGYLGIALVDFVGEWYDTPIDGSRSEWLFFLGLAAVTYDVSTYGPLLTAASLLASVLFFPDIGEQARRDWPDRVGNAITKKGSELTVLGGVVFFVYPAISVPSDPQTANGVVNVYSHALGFCLGYIVTYVTILLDGMD